jgi:hypothetical protein
MDELRNQVSNVLEGMQVDFGGGWQCKQGLSHGVVNPEVSDHLHSRSWCLPRQISCPAGCSALREYTGRTAYGVDPWLDSEARESGNPPLKRCNR